METKQIIGIILLVLGIGVLIYGINVKNSFQYQLGAAFGSGNDNVALVIAGGAIIGVIGLVMVISGKSTKTE